MPTDLPDPKPPADGPVRIPKKHVQIDHDVILPEPRPSDEPDVILPGDREGDGAALPYRCPRSPEGAERDARQRAVASARASRQALWNAGMSTHSSTVWASFWPAPKVTVGMPCRQR